MFCMDSICSSHHVPSDVHVDSFFGYNSIILQPNFNLWKPFDVRPSRSSRTSFHSRIMIQWKAGKRFTRRIVTPEYALLATKDLRFPIPTPNRMTPFLSSTERQVTYWFLLLRRPSTNRVQKKIFVIPSLRGLGAQACRDFTS